MSDEYRRVEAAFMARTDALCENTRPALCNCSECPAADMCRWLEVNA